MYESILPQKIDRRRRPPGRARRRQDIKGAGSINLKECYEKLGGNYEEVLGRLRREATVLKFLRKFPEDGSYGLFVQSMEAGDLEEALRAVHTLKGICQNLSFTRLFESSAQVTCALKEGDRVKAAQLAPRMAQDYAATVDAIGALIASGEGCA